MPAPATPPRDLPVWRSLMYVPANVPRFVAKSAGAGADAVVLDLEDSVPPPEKVAARERLQESIPIARGGGSQVLVRINQPLRQAVPDIEAALAAGADGILVTKCLGAQHMQLIAELVAAGEARPGATRLIGMIETAGALDEMAAIAGADPRVAALLLGGEDLATELNCVPDEEAMLPLKQRMVVAAAQAGRLAIGLPSTIADYGDIEGVRANARRARRLGFAGATCIHPKLVPAINEAFTPTQAETDAAQRMLDAEQAALAEGRGSFTVDGRMVDEPVLRRARRLLAIARAIAGRAGGG
jgi:citrate lyase subunit beta/citryl-CoA lyase